jgi:hypothetical protein
MEHSPTGVINDLLRFLHFSQMARTLEYYFFHIAGFVDLVRQVYAVTQRDQVDNIKDCKDCWVIPASSRPWLYAAKAPTTHAPR